MDKQKKPSIFLLSRDELFKLIPVIPGKPLLWMAHKRPHQLSPGFLHLMFLVFVWRRAGGMGHLLLKSVFDVHTVKLSELHTSVENWYKPA